MARKRETTTGIPKAKPKTAASGTAAREFRSRAEREAEIQKWLLRGTIAVVAAVVIIVVIALVKNLIIDPNQVVATVNGQNITVSQFQKRVRLEREFDNEQLNSFYNLYASVGYSQDQIQQAMTQQDPYKTMYNEMVNPDQMGLRVIGELTDDAIIRSKAKELNISVSDGDVQKEIDSFIGVDRTQITKLEATPEATSEATQQPTATPTLTPTPYVSPTPSPTPTITPTPAVQTTATSTPIPVPTSIPTATKTVDELNAQFADTQDTFFRTLRHDTGLSDGDIRDYFEMRAIRKAVEDGVTTDVAQKTMFVNARHILVSTEDEANDVLDALKAGESFADLAKATSKDTGSGANGGELGWAPAFQYVKPFADAVRDAPIGELIGPVKSDFGYHIIQIRAREDREVTDSQLQNAKDSAFNTWLANQKSAPDFKSETFSIWTNFVPTEPPFQISVAQ
jgi:parvulin-like peptidyl-prolyl isomerase